jgi:hypothetical protein
VRKNGKIFPFDPDSASWVDQIDDIDVVIEA